MPKAQIEVSTAYCLGVLLPVLEVARRRTNFDDFAHYIDDFLLGALLLYGAIAVTRRKPHGPVLLAVAWATLCGGMYGSFVDQLQSSDANDVSGVANALVAAIKGVIYAVAIVSLVLSIKRAIPKQISSND